MSALNSQADTFYPTRMLEGCTKPMLIAGRSPKSRVYRISLSAILAFVTASTASRELWRDGYWFEAIEIVESRRLVKLLSGGLPDRDLKTNRRTEVLMTGQLSPEGKIIAAYGAAWSRHFWY
jgi:hypothetical protein